MRRLALGLVASWFLIRCASAPPREISGGFFQDVSWSHDSRRIAYSRLRDNQWAVFVARADGSGELRISDANTNAIWTSWSPHDDALAFSAGSKKQTDIIVQQLGGEHASRNVTHDGAANAAPCWSPDGKRLVFTSSQSGKSHLYIIDADGANRRQITSGEANESNPQWSADGERILFYTDRGGETDVVYSIDPDGRNERRLTAPGIHAIFPGFGPAGEIVFAKWESGQPSEIMVIDGEGKATSTGQLGFFARISPNGKRIAVIAGKYPASRIVILRMLAER